MEKKINYPKIVIKSLLKSFCLLLFIYYAFIFAVAFEGGGFLSSSFAFDILIFPFAYFIDDPSVIWAPRGPSILFYAFGLIIFLKDLKKIKNTNA